MSEEKNTPVKCYLAGIINSEMDPDLQDRGFCRGMLVFAIPTLGILFRCRARGERIDLEFGAFFALLKFLKSKLGEERIRQLQVYSSNPEFVFAFTGKTRHLAPDSERMKLVKEYSRHFQIAVALVKSSDNLALASTADFPSLPADRSIAIKRDSADSESPQFKPFQRGIRI
ncbi:MAG TPA: hypothetical protein PLF13_08715 [candidate division Zixibacteria bacterium]|nr:hypothetical protein [candidate division Zixibacteria bacterium]